MTAPLDSSDKKIVAVAISLLVFLTILALLFASGEEQTSGGFASSYSTGRDGAKAAYLLLAETGYQVERWTNPPQDLPKPAAHTVLIVAGPFIPASEEEWIQLKQFVSGGGLLLVTGMTGAEMIRAKGIEAAPAPYPEWQTFPAETHSPFTENAPEISMQASARWVHLEAGQQRYYGSGEGSVVTRWRSGGGEIIWWAGDSPLTNYGIRRASNLALFLNSVGPPEGTRVLWDEYFHGVRLGLADYLARTPLPWALVQLLLLAAFVLATYARRGGALRPLRRESRLSPLEFVETVGALYQRKGAAAGALEIAFSRFRFLLARRLGLPITASTADLARSVREKPGWGVPAMVETLEQIDSAVKSQQVAEPKALAWVGVLYDFSQRLGL
jgi:hypothetical protein